MRTKPFGIIPHGFSNCRTTRIIIMYTLPAFCDNSAHRNLSVSHSHRAIGKRTTPFFSYNWCIPYSDPKHQGVIKRAAVYSYSGSSRRRVPDYFRHYNSRRDYFTNRTTYCRWVPDVFQVSTTLTFPCPFQQTRNRLRSFLDHRVRWEMFCFFFVR